jgi:hypothetical protein
MGPALIPAAAATRPKPKPRPPVCNLLTDPADQSGSPALDIVSADVATGHKSLTWVIRVVNLSSTADPSTTAGRQWTFTYAIGNKKITNTITDGPLGPTDRSGNSAVVVVNPAKNEVRYTLDLAKLSSTYAVTVVPGTTVISGFEASSSGLVQPLEAAALYQNLPGGDQAGPSAKSYVAGRASCVGAIA